MLVIAVGSARGDDAAAFLVGDCVRREARFPGIRVVDCNNAASLFDQWAGEAFVVVIDVVRSQAPAGTVHELDVTHSPLPANWTFASSHQFGLAHVVELARKVGRLPARLVIVGIEGERFEYGAGLSPAVAAAIPKAAAVVARTIVSGAAVRT